MGNKQSAGGDGASVGVTSSPPSSPFSVDGQLAAAAASTAKQSQSSVTSGSARVSKSSSFTSKIARKTVKTIVNASPMLLRRTSNSGLNNSAKISNASKKSSTERDNLSLPIASTEVENFSNLHSTTQAPKAPKRRKSSGPLSGLSMTTSVLSPLSLNHSSQYPKDAETASILTSVYHDARSHPINSPDDEYCDLESLTNDDDDEDLHFTMPHSLSHNLLDEIQIELESGLDASCQLGCVRDTVF